MKCIVVILVCIALTLVTVGCGKKTEEVAREEQSKAEVSSKKEAQELVFNLDEISVFELDRESRREFTRGQRGECGEEPGAEVKAYPAFKSDKPIYGSVRFAGVYGEKDSGVQYHFAIDESAGTGEGYDRLYFDLNCDLDLTNDKALAPWREPPSGAMLDYSSIKQQVCFDCLKIDFDFGGEDKRALEVMPRLIVSESGYTSLSFVTTKVRKGVMKLGGQRYDVLLGHDSLIGGWFDHPSTGLYLIPKADPSLKPRWWGADRLTAIHKIEGTYYRFSATPAGDKLTARPYDGDFGTFEMGAGGRDIEEMTARGSLRSEDAAVAVGTELGDGWPEGARSCRIPAGDYLPTYLRLTFGRLSIFISSNYHSDGKPRDRADRPQIYGIKIRKDKPYVFDFSNKPEVMFASPAKDDRIKLGEELKVKAILTDPQLDIMIRGLDDTSRKQTKEYETPDGEKYTREKTMSLDPKVLITRADGEKVAEGVLPFG